MNNVNFEFSRDFFLEKVYFRWELQTANTSFHFNPELSR